MSRPVPEGWTLPEVGELFELRGGGTPSTAKPHYWQGNVPWITSADIHGLQDIRPRKYVTRDGIADSAANTAPPGAIIVVTRVALGKVALVDRELSYSQDSQALVPHGRVVEPLFAAYALSRATGVFKHDNRGTTIKGVTKKDLRELSLLLPPLPEQKKIADILGSVDEAIRATKAVIEQTKKVKKGLLQQLLTRGIGHTRFKQTEIGEIPESWEVVRLGDVASCDRYSCVGGPFGSDLTSQDYVDVPGVPVIRGANMSGGPPGSNFDEAGFVYVSENKAESLHRNTAYRGDLLFTQRGTLGQVALIPANSFYPKYIVSQSQMKIALDAERAVPEYMLSLFGSDWGAKTIDDDAIATGVPHINLGIMKSFRVPLPPIEEQRAIAAMMAGPNKTTKVSLGVLHELTQMREGLMQDLLTGKVRV